ncbi:MAG: hypothetical protein ABWZ85_01935 [Luteibacter sp.]
MTPVVPWHLEALGLPAYADRVAVRRAYATALRGIDPATDPAGFARLREAYEAARAWCEMSATDAPTQDDVMPEAAAEPVPAADTGPSPQAPDVDGAADAPVFVDPTVTLAWRFAADVGARRAESAGALLADALAEVRTQYIDAPGRFEEYLIDLIGLQRIAHRAAVFAAAEEQCHWHEVGHLAALGERGQWIEAVLAQRDAWDQLAADRRKAWLDVFVRAEAQLDASLLRDWPDVARLNERYPAWLSLHVSSETLQAWQALFDAQTPSARDVFQRMASPDAAYLPAAVGAARERARRRSLSWTIAVFVLSMFVGISQLVVGGLRHGGTFSYDSTPLPADTPGQCAELYARFDRPDALSRQAPGEVELLKRRADRCASAGHWHPPVPGR